ncbi:type I restriction enzyme HsdR N-terminal domain-containing protein [Nostocaceae cyanobacterium CENA369]|uniref:Type I restriction enzyme HsdR N-terminal domain-containing protein n=1 Tax=Dendronalium phyllosphericum CENA369 TaxID=1725256 RepID=A0A8J7I4M5_9NOST|nr:type I restriction enzyme HsdR N-terminal domain-containing protein [Dendronalium phyllosphericum]MBH8573903.1 type I restriction enzyme HsdR N-terminal domain-containing protein [Dendronalium phyllosphericum CENA369]
MSISESIKNFIKWIQAFDNRILQNAYDVEKKFVLPLFQYLGYPDKCRQSKYPLTIHNIGINENQLEIVQIYFATDELIKQNADTSLIIVICLEPQKTDYQQAIEQAKFYSKYLNPVFFIITNGYHLNIFQFYRYHVIELFINTNTDLLINFDIASNFYNQLNFQTVKNIDRSISNLPTYTKSNFIAKFIKYHPDLKNVLAKTDFEPSLIREGNRLIVVKTQVLIDCNLPTGFSEGNCQIQFSSLVLRGIKVNLTHQYILGKLTTGLNTQPHWGCRRFLKQLDSNIFEVFLGQTTIILSELETLELCLCIDTVCQEYKNSIIEFETTLETWEFEFIEFLGLRGVHLFSVDSKLWDLMQKFAKKFNYTQGKSEWHLFHQEDIPIRVGRGIRDRAFIFPKNDTDITHIIYEINDVHLQPLERGNPFWQQEIGPRGIWTAEYTKQWLLHKYIPKVVDYYSQQFKLSQGELLKNLEKYQYELTPIEKINEIKELIPYLHNIQSWLNIYCENIAASVLQAYYQAFTDLVRNTDSSITGIDYILGNLRRVEWGNASEEVSHNSINWTNWNFKDAINSLERQIARLNTSEYENSLKADLITRTFIWILENGKICFSQAQLNSAKQALLPLWEQSRFEMRYVYPNR